MEKKDVAQIKVMIGIAVVAVLAIAAVIVGPKFLAGANSVANSTGAAAEAAGDAITSSASKAMEVIKTATGPLSSVPAITGEAGVVEMMKRDPKYDGSDIRVLPNKNDWYRSSDPQYIQMQKAVLDQFRGSPIVCVRYQDVWYYFGSINGEYCLVAIATTKAGFNPLGDKNAVWQGKQPPITWMEPLVSAFRKL